MDKKIKVIVMATFLLLSKFCNAQIIKVPFYIPSGATMETSRMYSLFINDFERKNPNINILFHPKTHYEEVLDIVLKLALLIFL